MIAEFISDVRKYIMNFGKAGVVLVMWGVFLGLMIDIFHLSALLFGICMAPITYLLRFILYKWVFSNKEKNA